MSRDLHPDRPTVYFDQWVWIRLSSARAGHPREVGDLRVLEAARRASVAGVVFPLSSTHYVETLKRKNPLDRAEVAAVMAEISHCRTLRSRRRLLDNQMLTAMHDLFGRPTFRPPRPDVLGVGTHWAFVGDQHQLNVHGPEEVLDQARSLLPRDDLCRLQQWTETRFLAGPPDEQIKVLRERYGYRPEKTEEMSRSRLEWEQLLAGLLAENSVGPAELRFRVRAREMFHEHIDRLIELFGDYGLRLSHLFGDPNRPVADNRHQLTSFVEAAPSIRLAADLKAELFRNKTGWKINHLHDVDAMSIAVPYCHVVVPDREIFDLMSRTKAGQSNRTIIVRHLLDLVDVLGTLEERAERLGGDRSGWDWLARGIGFDPQPPEALWPRSA